ncbi:VWD domain-containing protein [uncultured Roseovarius sp.]|uniref:VWD domain-containing protein n=1 Tax=uncultured Roseovarius sp. TaxID=293344 RepID=UPI00260C4387|nr:VWD domain-containing protein [uncultured Roseovarius sp.]
MALSSFFTFSGRGNWSLDATSGSRDNGGDISAVVPEGSEVVAAFLHASDFSGSADPTVTLSSGEQAITVENDDGDGITTPNEFISLGVTSGFSLQAHRADVTEFVSGVIGDGDVDPFTFSVSNMGSSIDGYSLEVIYSNPQETERTIALFDGFTNQDGDNFSLNLNDPLIVDDNLQVLMSLGIGFGFQSGNSSFDQQSNVDINGERLTSSAGGFDDGSSGNGGLITIGGLGDDPANPEDPNALPAGDTQEEIQRSDDELYDLARDGFLVTGDRLILVETLNPSNDDNIFFAGFNLTTQASIVSEGNNAPIAVDDGGNMAPGFTTDRDSLILTPSVLINDSDPDPLDVISVVGFEGTSPVNVGDTLLLPSGAEITLGANGSFFYDPNGAFDALPEGQDATDSFTYSISDGILTDTATVTIDVKDPDPAPVYLTISDASVLEGDSGSVDISFDVNRFGNMDVDVDVDVEAFFDLFSTADNADMAVNLPTVDMTTINAGAPSATVTFSVAGDDVPELDETFAVEIIDAIASDPSVSVEALFSGAEFATGTIIDDDIVRAPPPPPVEADIFGDPHLTTLDGLGYDFQAVGEFTLLESTSGDPINVQVRTEPINDAVSVITVMAMDVDGSRVQIDVAGDPVLTIDGEPTEINTLDGPVDVGDGQIFFDGETDEYTVVMPSGEQIKVGLFDGYMNVCAFLNEDREGGSVHGLLGNADGDTSNDLATREGNVLTQPVDFDVLYGEYADSWRITDDTALFDRAEGETTADFQDDSFPRVILTLDDLPPQVLANATAIVDASGLTDPILREAAILDVALTSNSSFATSATQLAATPTEETAPQNTPALGATIGVTAASQAINEGDSGERTALFEIYRIGDASGELDVEVAFGGTADADDVSSSLDPVTVSFADGETSQNVSVVITGDEEFEQDETISVTIDVEGAARDTVAIVGSSASTTITDDDAPVADDEANNLVGSNGDDTIQGLGGDDGVFGLEGDDALSGGDGDDNMGGAEGNDLVNGDAGNDNLGGGPGNDTMNGGEGDDFMGGGLDDDLMDGGDGNDVVNSSSGNDTLDGGAGNDTMGANIGADEVNGGDGNDDIGGGTGQDTIDAGAGDDSVGGGEGNDDILGGDGNDFLAGGGRDDTIDGGAGDDSINGGDGDDDMTGGDGADVFVFNFFKDGDNDVITDFEDGTDSFLIRTTNLETGEANIDNGGNGLSGFLDALNITDVEGGAQMDIDGHLVLVEGVAAADLTLDDFSFIG